MVELWMFCHPPCVTSFCKALVVTESSVSVRQRRLLSWGPPLTWPVTRPPATQWPSGVSWWPALSTCSLPWSALQDLYFSTPPRLSNCVGCSNPEHSLGRAIRQNTNMLSETVDMLEAASADHFWVQIVWIGAGQHSGQGDTGWCRAVRSERCSAVWVETGRWCRAVRSDVGRCRAVESRAVWCSMGRCVRQVPSTADGARGPDDFLWRIGRHQGLLTWCTELTSDIFLANQYLLAKNCSDWCSYRLFIVLQN